MGTTNTFKRTMIFAGMAGLAAAMLMLGVMIAVAPQPAEAFPAYAQQTGMHCSQCHVKVTGGGPLTKYGTKWFTGGMKTPKSKK
jgi:mono/diheme cytochrome c family protein